MLYNLLANAVKFTPRGGAVTVAVTSLGAQVEIAVTDTGIGIAAEDQARLFAPFEQLDAGVARKYEGTGLGLVMVKRLTELHGGSVGLESEPGQGSRFWVRLPCVSAPRAAPRAPAPGAAGLGAPRILVVEDDPAAVALARQWLAGAGYAVESVESPEGAWPSIQADPPAAILLDLLFSNDPQGYALLEQLKGASATAAIPVIIISIAADERRGLALGAAAVLQKPASGEAIRGAVASLGLRPVQPGESLQVLVVDDDPRAVEHVARRLEEAGVSVTRAYGGAEALAAIAARPPDAVILDLMMPEVSGFDVVRALREEPSTARLPVIVLTARDLDARERSRLEATVTSVLAKGDWQAEAFLRTVGAALGRSAAGPVARPTAVGPAPAPAASGGRILVVDDDPVARDLLRLYLEDAGHTVTGAAGVAEALAAVEAGRPDLITLDLSMPETDGFELLRLAATDPRLAGIPVVVVSGADRPERAMGLGAGGVLAKPVQREELLATVGRFVGTVTDRVPVVVAADDDPRAIKILTSHLDGAPLELTPAYGGAQALERVRALRPDLLILDLMMPDVSGFEVLAALRADPETASLPVLVLTAKQLTAADRASLAQQAQAVFSKADVTQGDLLERVRLLLDRARRGDRS